MRNENLKKYFNFHLTYVCRELLSSTGALNLLGKIPHIEQVDRNSTVHVQY
jgi:hypothetical protein